jgi:hypothetical protein
MATSKTHSLRFLFNAMQSNKEMKKSEAEEPKPDKLKFVLIGTGSALRRNVQLN